MTSKEPVYEATVHPDLALLLQGRSPGPATDRSDPLPVSNDDTVLEDLGSSPDALQGPVFPALGTSAFVPVILRRDGKRPIKAVATLLWDATARVEESGAEEASLDRRVRLFLTPHGEVLAQLSYHPGEGCAARPVVSVEPFEEDGDLSDLLTASPPELCFAVGNQMNATAHALCARLKAIPAIHPSLVDATAST